MILESGLVLLAIVLGGLLLTPMTRTTISYMAATNTPDWAEKRVGTSAGTRLLLNINLLLPGLVALIWVSNACWTVHNTVTLQSMLNILLQGALHLILFAESLPLHVWHATVCHR